MDNADISSRQTEMQFTVGRVLPYLLVFLLIGSVTLNVLLARKIGFLRQIEADLRSAGNLQLGETVPVLEAKTLDGKTVSFSYGTSELPVVIYVLSPGCKWCEKNQRSVEVLAKSITNKYRFIALSLASTNLKQYLDENDVAFPGGALHGQASQTDQSIHIDGTIL